MEAPERDWAPIMALMAHLYHMGPWDVERLTEGQLQMYMEQSGHIRLLDHLPMLQANFGQLNEEARLKLIADADKKPDPESVDARAWRIFIRTYQTEQEAAKTAHAAPPLPIHPETAEAIIKWVELGEMSKGPDGARVWREDLFGSGLWDRLLATAEPQGA